MSATAALICKTCGEAFDRGAAHNCRGLGGYQPDRTEGDCVITAAMARTTPFPGPWRLVILESPYAGDVDRNVAYARAAMRDCLVRGDAPAASHLLYTQPGVLDDGNPEERARGIDAGLAWGRVAEATVVYTDLGISGGMGEGVKRAFAEGRPVEWRTLAGWR
ncbi:hypothetical protein [Mesorhizobium sp. CA4]|uniref:DUF7768 domain-containing protein n=1 Tax=Mesorhizobium sp. CA4 TaxID=588499 RepID=UPI001CD1252F|nr:hypothetical protein [Mesorhizobium sp. CA4]MBZ9821903.1 hypothetical protein [Mesorhizobium sp. CA4]